METFQVQLERQRLNFKRFKAPFMLGLMVLLVFLVLYHRLYFNVLEGTSPSDKVKVMAGRSEEGITDLLNGSEPQSVGAMAPSNEAAKDYGLEDGQQNNTVGGEGFKSTPPLTIDTQQSSQVREDSSSSTHSSTDKLLHGLLSPGFEKASCLSRYRSYLYRKASPNIPSPYLISKLRKYERLHRRCGPYTKSYNKTMSRLAKSNHVNGDSEKLCKFIVWTPVNGLGNRMVSLVAGFLYGVLTDRVLLVRFGNDMKDLFCEPFPNSSWILPQTFPSYSKFDKLLSYENIITKYLPKKLPGVMFLDIQHHRDGFENLFHCDHNQKLLQKIPALYLRSDQYFVPTLFITPSFKKDLNDMFPERFTVFHHLGRYLFHPSNEAWGQITRFYDIYLANANERIGLQIRVFHATEIPLQTVIDQILSCTTKHNLLPEVSVSTQESISKPKNLTKKAVFVASLHSEFSEYLSNMYWRKQTKTGAVVGVYQASHDKVQKRNDNAQNMKAWSEMYLLSLCDVLVTSGESTFGYVAQGLGGVKPWFLKKSKSNKVADPPCKRDLSVEPCFHYPPKLNCDSNTKLDVAAVFTYIKHCPDRGNGVKLV